MCMPDHKTHDLAALSLAPIIAIGSLAYVSPKDAGILFAGIIVSNYYLSPDLDINSIMNKRWGILHVLWKPYMHMFHHRSFFTHSGMISATIRIFYLLVLLSPLFFVIDVIPFILLFRRELLIVYVSIVMSDSIHTGLDFLQYATKIPFSFWKNTYRHR